MLSFRRRNRSLSTAVARFGRDQRGVTAVEFAFVAPAFFFLIFVIAQTALVFLSEQILDNAVYDAARLIRTGQAQTGGFTTAQFKADVCNQMTALIDCDDGYFYMDVKSYSTFGEMNVADPLDKDDKFPKESDFDFGSANQIVVVRAYYQMWTAPLFWGLSLSNLSNGRRLIGTTVAFRNEPFAKTSSGGTS